MKIEQIAPGMTVYSCRRCRESGVSKWGIWEVKVVSIINGTVIAKWNNNREQEFSQASWKKWTLEKPLLISQGMGNRKATAAEKKAHKEKEG